MHPVNPTNNKPRTIAKFTRTPANQYPTARITREILKIGTQNETCRPTSPVYNAVLYNNEDKKRRGKRKKKKEKNDRNDRIKVNGEHRDRCSAAINAIIELRLTGYRSTIIPGRGKRGDLLQVRASRGSSSRLAVIGRADGRGSLGFLAVESEERVALADAIKAGYIVRREKNEGYNTRTHTIISSVFAFLRS